MRLWPFMLTVMIATAIAGGLLALIAWSVP